MDAKMPHSHGSQDAEDCRGRICLLCYILLVAVILFPWAGWLIFAWARDSEPDISPPCIYVESLDVVTPLKVNHANPPSMSNLTGSWNVSFSYYNYGKVDIFYYDYIDVAIYYGDTFLSNATTTFWNNIVQPMRQKWVDVTTTINASASSLDDAIANSLARDIESGQAIIFNLKVATIVAFTCPSCQKSRLMISIPDIQIGYRPSHQAFACWTPRGAKDIP